MLKRIKYRGRCGLLSLGLLAFFVNLVLCAESPQSKKSYVVVVRETTLQKPELCAVVEKLRIKYDASVVSYVDRVFDAKSFLSKVMPNYTCFVTESSDVTRRFVVDVQRLTRTYDDDIYTDTMWGILTGYEASDALRIASLDEPLVVRRALGGSSALNLDHYDEAIRYDEGRKGGRFVKRNGGEIINEKEFSADSTQGLVDGFNKFKPDIFYTSGHGFPGGWQIGFNYKDGFFRSQAGKVYGVDTQNKKFEINSPNSKVYLPCGNCLVGLIENNDAYSLAMMHSAGVNQMFGYVVVTFFGYMGWGIDTYFTGMKNHYTLSESFYANQQALLCTLNEEFPKLIWAEFSDFTQKCVAGLVNKVYPNSSKAMGLFWDRDAVVFYGDPAWKAVYPVCEKAWNYTLETNAGRVTLTVTTHQAGKWPNRPILIFLPDRFENIELVSGHELKPTLTDNFILLPLVGDYKANEKWVVSFEGRKQKQVQTSSKGRVIIAEKVNSVFDYAREIDQLNMSKESRKRVLAALKKSAGNCEALVTFLTGVDEGLLYQALFLIEHMPDRDLKTVSAELLLNTVKSADHARRTLPWDKVPEAIFLNDVLPYAVVNERRDQWRSDFYQRFFNLVKDCASAREAAVVLNLKIWKLVDVKYSTRRPKADQSACESIAAKLASCTGLSILLIDACRAVGIPARLVGVPSWTGKSGNHSWVEIWDDGWHFLGAFDGKKLDEGWFVDGASKANDSNWMYQVYATSFKKQHTYFPCVWDSQVKYVPAVIRTPFYNGFAKNKRVTRLFVKVYDRKTGNRLVAEVTVMHQEKQVASGLTSSEIRDSNDMLGFSLIPQKKYQLIVKYSGKTIRQMVTVSKSGNQTIKLYF